MAKVYAYTAWFILQLFIFFWTNSKEKKKSDFASISVIQLFTRIRNTWKASAVEYYHWGPNVCVDFFVWLVF